MKDINSLVGNNLPIENSQLVVNLKPITIALAWVHIVALAGALISAGFLLFKPAGQMWNVGCHNWVAILAFLFSVAALALEVVLFLKVKVRIRPVGSAETGSAVWIISIALVLLFFSAIF